MTTPAHIALASSDESPSPDSAVQTIRPCREEDLPGVLDLLRQLYPKITDAEMAGKSRRLHERMMNSPWKNGDIGSLVCETGSRITGFLGVDPRRMRYREETVDVAVSFSFMVHPDHRSGMVALNLMKTFLSGPQDLSLADSASDLSRRIWERLGGKTLPMRSMYWKHIVRPAGFAAQYLRRKKIIGPLVSLARPLVRAADTAFDYFRDAQAATLPKGVHIRELPPDLLAACIRDRSADKKLAPAYTSGELKWLLDLAGGVSEFGRLRREAVTDRRENILGWMIYYSNPGGVNEVLQLKAIPGREHLVVSALFGRARQQGAVEVSGRLDPELTVALAGFRCFYLPRMWMLVHSRHEGIRDALAADDLFLSRLEGDLWLV